MKDHKTFITTSIPYVNGAPHVGHALEFVEVDVLKRAQALLGADSRSQTGSDENSLKNVQAAEKVGEDTAAFVERHAERFDELAKALNCDFDRFIRTREDEHMQGAQKLWSMCKPEDIYKKSYSGLYCVGCEAFYTEKEVEDDTCPIHKKPLDTVEEENYFFRLSNYQDKLLELLKSKKYHIYPESRRNEMIAFIERGLEDFSISRSQERAKHWGVPVPNDDSQVMYVWFDALSNYVTGLGFATDDDLYKKYWEQSDVRMHVVGKDIVRFHAIYWPAMLLSAGLPLPTDLYVHGFFTINGEKMSKSLGNVIDPFELIEDYGAEAFRYILLKEMSYASDGDLSRDRMNVRYAELANQYGNLASRVAAMSVSYFEGNLDDSDFDSAGHITALTEHIESANLKAYLDKLSSLIQEANEYIDKTEPFKLVKDDEAAAKRVLSELRAQILFISTWLAPVLPTASQTVLDAYSGTVEKIAPLFPRRD
jgi:methionyl-tRNA synthetase